MEKAYSTQYSKAVAQPSTSQARRGLTSVIGREPVLSAWYGRRPKYIASKAYLNTSQSPTTAKMTVSRRTVMAAIYNALYGKSYLWQ